MRSFFQITMLLSGAVRIKLHKTKFLMFSIWGQFYCKAFFYLIINSSININVKCYIIVLLYGGNTPYYLCFLVSLNPSSITGVDNPCPENHSPCWFSNYACFAHCWSPVNQATQVWEAQSMNCYLSGTQRHTHTMDTIQHIAHLQQRPHPIGSVWRTPIFWWTYFNDECSCIYVCAHQGTMWDTDSKCKRAKMWRQKLHDLYIT